MTFSKTEQEAIILESVWSMIDDMVNFAIFAPLDGRTQDIMLWPISSHTRRLFNVLLGDFLSPLGKGDQGKLPFDLPTPPGGARASDRTFLFYLRKVFENPQLSSNVDAIRVRVEAFTYD